jgi:hypothetical protein
MQSSLQNIMLKSINVSQSGTSKAVTKGGDKNANDDESKHFDLFSSQGASTAHFSPSQNKQTPATPLYRADSMPIRKRSKVRGKNSKGEFRDSKQLSNVELKDNKKNGRVHS